MSFAERFIISSDFTTLKNDNQGTVSVTVPATTLLSSGTTYIASADLTIGTTHAEQRVRIKSSLLGSQYYLGFLGVNRTGSIAGTPAPYTVYAFTTRINATTIRCYAYIPNPYGTILIGATSDETFTFTVNTFISPLG